LLYNEVEIRRTKAGSKAVYPKAQQEVHTNSLPQLPIATPSSTPPTPPPGFTISLRTPSDEEKPSTHAHTPSPTVEPVRMKNQIPHAKNFALLFESGQPVYGDVGSANTFPKSK
jgi:hypothetical protein